MKISPRNLLIGAAVLVLAVAVALVVVLILPQNAKLKTIEANTLQQDQQIQQAQALLNQRQQSKKRAALTAAELLRLAEAVPDTPELPSLIIELQSMTVATGLQFRSLTPQTPAPAWSGSDGPQASYLKVPMAMQVIGTWSDTVEFLQRLNRMPRQLRVTAVNSQFVADPPTNPPDPMPTVPIQTDLTIEAYVVPSAGATATVAPSTTTP